MQDAFKDSMIHNELQFTLSVAFHYVLHRNESLGIPCKTLQNSQNPSLFFHIPKHINIYLMLNKTDRD